MRIRRNVAAWFVLLASVNAAEYRTANFDVTAGSTEDAREVGEAAERYRTKLLQFWFHCDGETPWPERIAVRVEAQEKTSGLTTFAITNGRVHSFRMIVRGDREDVLQATLPHEVNHCVFAHEFRRFLPRWLDEGAAYLFEHPTEKQKVVDELKRLQPGEWIDLQTVAAYREYPSDGRKAFLFYAQSYAAVDHLVQWKGVATFVQFLRRGLQNNAWLPAFRDTYGCSIDELDQRLQYWISQGCPDFGHEETAAGEERSALYFGAEYCDPCRQMRSWLHRMPAVKQHLIDRAAAAAELAKRYNVDRVPTLIILEGGKEVARHVGYRNEREVQSLLSTHRVAERRQMQFNGRHIVFQRSVFGGYPSGWTPLQIRSRSTSTVRATGQCVGNICPIHGPQPAASTTGVIAGGCNVVVDYERVAREVFERYGEQLRGRDGRNGTDGRNGIDGTTPQVDLHELADVITRDYADRIRGRDGQHGSDGTVDYDAFAALFFERYSEQLRGPQGRSGGVGVPDDQDIRNWLVGAASDPQVRQMIFTLVADSVANDPRFEQLIERLEALEGRSEGNALLIQKMESVLLQMQKPPPSPETDTDNSEGRRLIYFTSTKGCSDCDDINSQVESLKAKGYPITVVDLDPTNVEVRGVPRLHVPSSGKTVQGRSNVATFLATLIP